MQSAADRLRFAVAFAGADLDGFRPGDWLNLRADLAAFTSAPRGQPAHAADFGGIIPFVRPVRPLPRDCPEEACRHLQHDTQVLLAAVADRSGLNLIALSGGILTSVQKHLTVAPTGRLTGPSSAVVLVRGPFRDIYLEILIALLSQGPLPPIGRCPEPACARLFYRVRRQRFCSRTCANRASMRAHLERPGARDKKSAANHQAYVRRQRQRTGNPRLKIARRPRGG